MKIREGFVSNSSSSSYTCDVSGETYSGMDLGLSDVGMMDCIHGHTFLSQYAQEYESSWEDRRATALHAWSINEGRFKHLRPIIEAAITEAQFEEIVEKHDIEWLCAEDYDVPEKGCPICSFKNAHRGDAFLYLLKVAGRTETDLLAELKEKFATYGEMKQWLKE